MPRPPSNERLEKAEHKWKQKLWHLSHQLVSSEHHTGKGRPRKEARRKACFIVATNVLDSTILSAQELVTTYQEQGSVERGFRFVRICLVSGLLRVRQKAAAQHRAWVDHGALLDFPIGWPNIGCARA